MQETLTGISSIFRQIAGRLSQGSKQVAGVYRHNCEHSSAVCAEVSHSAVREHHLKTQTRGGCHRQGWEGSWICSTTITQSFLLVHFRQLRVLGSAHRYVARADIQCCRMYVACIYRRCPGRRSVSINSIARKHAWHNEIAEISNAGVNLCTIT